MKWSNLKANKCPKCNKDLLFGIGDILKCSCGFSIGSKRMKEIVSSKVHREIESHYRPDDEVPDVEY